GFTISIVWSLIFVTIGNIVGGLLVGFLEKYRLSEKEQN
ncbi:MAG: hypothetical protein K0R90_700, partial [Oscillospiraceae bacterium]|nr:hypothetical protein [Oscillospiraceae bacterium]